MAERIHDPSQNLPTDSADREIVSWTEPPAPIRKTAFVSTYTNVARQLREHPGQWAQLDDRSSFSAAYQFSLGVRYGRPAAFRPAGAFEGRYSGCSVWVRYVGEGAVTAQHAPEQERKQAPDLELQEEPRPDPRTVFGF